MLQCMLGGQSLLVWQWVVPVAANVEPENAKARLRANNHRRLHWRSPFLVICGLRTPGLLFLFVGAPRRLDAASRAAKARLNDINPALGRIPTPAGAALTAQRKASRVPQEAFSIECDPSATETVDASGSVVGA
jgi:hypothetical protein